MAKYNVKYSKDELPEGTINVADLFRVEKGSDGTESYVLDVNPVDGWDVQDVGGLKNAHIKVTEERNQYRDAIPQDFDWESLPEIQRQAQEYSKGNSASTEISEKYQAEQETTRGLRQQNTQLYKENLITKMSARFGGNEFLPKQIADDISVTFDPKVEKFSVQVIDPNTGKARGDVDSNHQPIDFPVEKLFEEKKADPRWQPFFNAEPLEKGADTPPVDNNSATCLLYTSDAADE